MHFGRDRRMRRSAQWLLRCLLIALFALDLVGSPLHAHHHDSGTFQLDIEASAEHVDDASHDAHVESGDAPRAFMHSVVALRASAVAIAAPIWADEADSTPAPVAAFGLSQSTAAPELPWQRARERVRLGVFRSLPPDGRAPPVLHG